MTGRDAIETWLGERIRAGCVTVERFVPMAGGASRAAFAVDARVEVEGRTYGLGLVLRTAGGGGGSDEGTRRQFRLLRALAGTPVQAPVALWHEADAAVVGTPFLVTQRVEGQTGAVPWFRAGDPGLEACAEALAGVHSVDWSARVGAVVGEPSGTPIETELGAWRGRVQEAGLEDEPVLRGLADWLRRNEPGDARLGLTHGDPNAGNFVMRYGRVAAVLDWELGGLGEPRSDLGFYAAMQWLCGGPTSAGGRTGLSDAYEAVTGREVGALGYYEAWGLFRMAVILASRREGPGHFGLDAIACRLDDVLGRRWAG